MGTPFSNPVVQGGTGSLVIPQIQSPDYVTGVSGWAIFQNGNVEFNSGTFRGTISAGTFEGTDFVINPAGAFFYNGSPAAGNLIVSIAAAAGTDAHGNAYEAGVTSYVTVAGSIYAVQLGNLAGPVGGFAALTLQNLTSPAAEPAAVLVRLSVSGCTLEAYSGASTILASPAALALSDSVAAGGNPTAAFGGASVTAGSFNGVPLAQQTPPSYTGAAAGNPPTSGAGAGAGFCTPGDPLAIYLTAFATDLNAVRTAYLSLVTQLQASGVLS